MTYLLIGGDVASQLDFSKGALTDGLAEDVLTNLALVWSQLDVVSLLVRLRPNLIRITYRLVDFLLSCSRGPDL